MSGITPSIPEAAGIDLMPPQYSAIRTITSFLKWRFSCLPKGAFRWLPETETTPDQVGSEIFFAATTPIQPSIVGQRPAITVGRSGAAGQGLGLGDLAFRQLATGAAVRMDLMATNIVVNVLSSLPVVAERLAYHCQLEIFTFREEIVKNDPCFHSIGARASLSPPTDAGSLVVGSSDIEWTLVQLVLPAWVSYSSTKLPLNKKVVSGFTTRMEVARPEDQPPLVTPPGVVPLQGTAIWQPQQPASDRASALGSGVVLPQTGSDEAQSTEPLTVTIETK